MTKPSDRTANAKPRERLGTGAIAGATLVFCAPAAAAPVPFHKSWDEKADVAVIGSGLVSNPEKKGGAPQTHTKLCGLFLPRAGGFSMTASRVLHKFSEEL
ncbi:hypothetical protein [Actibacterium lipolyticum]|uniref:Uncharacterized protein n=1 Tax=Actibacterium lipolyticum TaxID=1524263 RepID=A0A238KL77_9RHOB|nr:hypothetical protein [Actibacterium lipolyticum]SMX43377.1 hypothetical protein COL8621_02286 [Actibacterium lipolyticum]